MNGFLLGLIGGALLGATGAILILGWLFVRTLGATPAPDSRPDEPWWL